MQRVPRDDQGRVIGVQQNEVLSADHELAVQGREDPRVNGKAEGGALAPLLELSPKVLAERDE